MDILYIVLFVCYASYAFNRKSVTFSLPKLKEDGFDTSDAGLIISCQNFGFAISKFWAGVLSDRINPYLLFVTGIFISGFATITFSSSASVTTFCILWFLNGLAQGCGWPSCAKILRQRAPPSQFGTLWSFLSSSNNVSGSFGPLISAFIIIRFGWRWSVFFAGSVTVLLGVLFLLFLSFSSSGAPAKIPEAKKSPDSADKTEETPKTGLLDLFLEPLVWLLSFGFMAIFCARTTTLDWGQMYLIEDKKHSQYMASAFTSSVETGGFFGRLAAGYLTDCVIKRNTEVVTRSKSSLRMSVALVFVLLTFISIHLFQFTVTESSSSVWITGVGALMGMSYYGPIAIFGIVAAESVPSHLSGSSNAIVGLSGNVGAMISGLPFSYVAKYHGWPTVFFGLEVLAVGLFLVLLKYRNLQPKLGRRDKEE